MLCSVCNEREAKVHLTQCIGETVNKVDLCEVCAKEFVDLPLNVEPPPLTDTIERIVDRDSRYPKKAYLLVLGGMQLAYENRLTGGNVPSIHLSVPEILETLIAHSRAHFGTNAKAVLSSWGIRNCADFGEIIFNLVEANLLAKRPEDTREAFQQGFDFDQAFPAQ